MGNYVYYNHHNHISLPHVYPCPFRHSFLLIYIYPYWVPQNASLAKYSGLIMLPDTNEEVDLCLSPNHSALLLRSIIWFPSSLQGVNLITSLCLSLFLPRSLFYSQDNNSETKAVSGSPANALWTRPWNWREWRKLVAGWQGWLCNMLHTKLKEGNEEILCVDKLK